MKMRMVLIVVALLGSLPLLPAADWPQWRGPDRTDVSKETGLLKDWKTVQPRLLWTYKDAGNAYSSLAIVGNVAYTMGGEEGKNEFVLALDVDRGTRLWSTEIGPWTNNNWGGGPRGTPTVDGNLLYAISSGGNLTCLDVKTGKVVWTVSLTKDLGGNRPGWNYSESPLIDGNLVVCTPGGKKGTVAALDKKTGKVIWRCTGATDSAGYSSVIVAQPQGNKIYVQQTMQGVLGIDPKDGSLLWSIRRPKYSTAVIPTPVYADDCVYVTSGYNAGCTLIKLSDGGKKAEIAYENRAMVNQHGGVLLVGKHIYGYSDSEGWICQDFKTGDQVWPNKEKKDKRVNFGKGSVTCAEGKLYCYSERSGEVVLANASPEGWVEAGRFTIPEKSQIRSRSGGIWAHPVVANGRLYLRDQDLIFCYDIKEAK